MGLLGAFLWSGKGRKHNSSEFRSEFCEEVKTCQGIEEEQEPGTVRMGINRERDGEESKRGMGLCGGGRQRKRQSWDARRNQTTALFLLVVIVLLVYLINKKGGAS